MFRTRLLEKQMLRREMFVWTVFKTVILEFHTEQNVLNWLAEFRTTLISSIILFLFHLIQIEYIVMKT